MAVPVEPEPEMTADVFGDGVDRARRYVELLATDGILHGLIGPRERARLWSRHVLNSAVAAPLLPADGTIVDIGSGAGLPGIPMAIARPDCRLVLVEPLERRCAFLVAAIAALGLENCEVVRGRAEQVAATHGGADAATSRAVAPLAKLAGWSVPFLRTGGELLALKGSSASEEIERDRAALLRLGLAELSVIPVGAGVVDPPTQVVRGVMGARPAAAGRSSRSSRRSGRSARG
ncbi:16S rRNA (guanine(527)-N(7))-methyltransferase RsmG [Nakamurella sp. YIM 132087]|uniref:Ribosomal RNA small subunit methyltransferase G n=2 Tax=Nakamurella alba TaxID=2665158 RepID=A0A7K1FLQ1_9ACTN|nr:16S rRNA (guanine(527)-N(7))-methyltransferase RsmG [Nakamurella alba]